MRRRTKTEYVIVHCSANVRSTVETVRRTHKQRGFSDVGYHFLISKDGTVHTGRAEHLQGAHCIGRNHDSIGICLLGHFDLEEVPSAMETALEELVADLRTKYPIGRVQCHTDYKPTKTCPGVNAYPIVRRLDAQACP